MLRDALIRKPINPLMADPLAAVNRQWLGTNQGGPRFGARWGEGPDLSWPQADLAEFETAWSIDIDLPGVEKENIGIALERNLLSVVGERPLPESAHNRTVSRTERWHGAFRRTFLLPSAADGDRIVAKFDKGVLTITVPKSEEAQPRRISVH